MGKLFKAVFYTTLFSILTRALGFFLRVYLSRVLGAELLGAYQIAMSVFSVLLTLVASGLPTIIGRTVANLRSREEIKKERQIVSSGLVIALSVAIISSFLILLFPQVLDLIFTSKSSTTIVLLLLPGLVASSVYTILRGALWGQKRFFTISFAEFFEQAIRMIILFILVMLPLNIGLDARAALSLSIACVISMIFVIIMFFAFGGKLASPAPTMKPLMKKSTPITAVRTISNLVTSAISIIIPARLMLYGFTASEALAEYGTIMGMSFPLLMIPGTIIGAIAMAFVPEISEQTTNIDKGIKNKTTLTNQITIAISLSIIVSVLLFPTYLILGKEIGLFLYASEKAGLYLSWASFLMLPLGLSQITGAVLNAVGLEMKSLKNSAVAAALLFACIYFLPKYIGIWALIVGMGALTITQSVLNLLMLAKRGVISRYIFKVLGLLVIFSFPSALLGKLTSSLAFAFLPSFIALIIAGIVTTGTFGLLVLCSNLANVKAYIFKRKKHKLSYKDS